MCTRLLRWRRAVASSWSSRPFWLQGRVTLVNSRASHHTATAYSFQRATPPLLCPVSTLLCPPSETRRLLGTTTNDVAKFELKPGYPEVDADFIQEQLKARIRLKRVGNTDGANLIRTKLHAMGVRLVDTRPYLLQGPSELSEDESNTVRLLLAERANLRLNGDFSAADALQKQLAEKFRVTIIDSRKQFKVGFVAPTPEVAFVVEPGYEGIDSAEVQQVLAHSIQLRKAGDVEGAEWVRKKRLHDKGVRLVDSRPYMLQGEAEGVDVEAVERVLAKRSHLRANGDFGAADSLRRQLLNEHGVSVLDRQRIWRRGQRPAMGEKREVEGVRYALQSDVDTNAINFEKLEAKILRREELRRERRYDKADELLHELERVGVTVYERSRVSRRRKPFG